MIGPTNQASGGSRAAAYVVAGGLGSVAAWAVLAMIVGFGGATAALVVAWATGVVWLLRKRQEDSSWDHR